MRYKLLVVLAVIAAVLIGQPLYAVTQTGDITVSGTVPTPPPATAPTIDQPHPNDVSEQKHITISGHCIAGLIVKIFSNGNFVGSAVCQPNNTYSLPIDLYLERNDLVARQYDNLNQPSPDSNVVSVYYIPPETSPLLPPGTTPPPAIAHFQLIIDYDYTVQGIFADQSFRLPITFRGGSGPYIVTVDWGDGSSNTFDRSNTETFDTTYTYSRPGAYIVKLKVRDSIGQEAYLQFVILVHGEPDRLATMRIFGQEITNDIGIPVAILCILLASLAFVAGRQKRQKKH